MPAVMTRPGVRFRACSVDDLAPAVRARLIAERRDDRAAGDDLVWVELASDIFEEVTEELRSAGVLGLAVSPWSDLYGHAALDWTAEKRRASDDYDAAFDAFLVVDGMPVTIAVPRSVEPEPERWRVTGGAASLDDAEAAALARRVAETAERVRSSAVARFAAEWEYLNTDAGILDDLRGVGYVYCPLGCVLGTALVEPQGWRCRCTAAELAAGKVVARAAA